MYYHYTECFVCTCFMLKSIKIPNHGTPHDYPKRILAHLLCMAYWTNIDHVTWRLLEGNVNLFNEEYGEMFFSILSRAVLGDHIKANFDHMDKIYKLLPVYRDVKDEIQSETNPSSNSINWHYTIPADSREVSATSFFFERTIRQIMSNSYKSYRSKTKFANQITEQRDVCTTYIPIVYFNDVHIKCAYLYDSIHSDIVGI